MRRVGLVLAGLGTGLIVFAVLMTTWVTGRVIKFPLHEYVSVTLTDGSASYFSLAKLAPQTGVTVEAIYTIKGNAAKGSSSTAVWDQFIYVYDQSNKLPVQSMTRTFAFDRRTAKLVNCCGANVNGNTSVQQTGYVGYVLPIGTKKQTYDIFDTNLGRPEPFKYTGTSSVDGTQAYSFTETVPPTQNGTQTVPGSLVNSSQATVTLPQYYQTQTTYWIDPVTGALVNVTQNEKLTLRNPDGSQALLVFQANLAATQSSIDNLVAHDNGELTKAGLVGTLLPLFTGIAGLVLLIAGLLLLRRERDDVEAGHSHAAAEFAAAEPEHADRSPRPSLVPGLDDESHEATAESPALTREAAAPEAASAGAATAEAQAAEAKETSATAEAPAASAEARAESQAAGETREYPAAAEPQAAEAQAVAEEAPTEQIPVQAPAASATAEVPPEAAESSAADQDATGSPRRGRRGSHRR